LFLFLQPAHGNLLAAPLDIYGQLSRLRPGTDVNIAYELWGQPHARIAGNGETDLSIVWQPALFEGRVVLFVSLENGNIIKSATYSEIYTQKTLALTRYEEFKEAFCEILGVPVKGNSEVSIWNIDHYFIFSVDYVETDYDSKRVTIVTVSSFTEE
jgi:hypothetical protein